MKKEAVLIQSEVEDREHKLVGIYFNTISKEE